MYRSISISIDNAVMHTYSNVILPIKNLMGPRKPFVKSRS